MTTDTNTFSIGDWLSGRLPSDWFTALEVTLDREEITITGTIPAPEAGAADGQSGRIKRFREETRAARIEIALELEERTGRKVSWAVTCGDTTEIRFAWATNVGVLGAPLRVYQRASSGRAWANPVWTTVASATATIMAS